MKKFILSIIPLLATISAHANDDVTYSLTPSNQNSSLLFEKTDQNITHSAKQYYLEKKQTSEGVEYYFKLENSAPIEGTAWVNSTQQANSYEEALTVCQNLTLNNEKWSLPTLDEVSTAAGSENSEFKTAIDNNMKGYTIKDNTNNGFFYSKDNNHVIPVTHRDGANIQVICLTK
ncbi:hypothetical protein [Photobacterium damselae]|uniref:hypothetical protein n=1 Tax=Photobacterium damselae TaxID=38293 RepID=UPI001F3C81B7|nr:hypothetical protein [Photobacterium damselae]UKA31319.1 hypothetical protein IPQ37_15720 [Photobacterium damselae subsp. damselae]